MKTSRLIATSLVALVILSVFTQFYKLTDVPGFHFDEAWQGLYAHRIATEKGFWPLTAMNSYTSPVVHYLLAAVFKMTSPTLYAMRLTYGFLNLTTLFAVALLLWHRAHPKAALWFALFWALLPLSVHNHRFYIEMTGFHGFCFAALLWGCALWNQKPKTSVGLIITSVLLGSYSHILFIGVFLSLILIWPLLNDHFPKRSARTAGFIAVGLAPLALNMGFSLQKKLPLALGGLFLFGGLALFLFSMTGRANETLIFWREKLKKPQDVATKLFYLAAVPFSLFYIIFLWDGFWTYAQVTGNLSRQWIPLNSLLFLGTLFQFVQKSRQASNNKPCADTALLWRGFIILFVISSAMILKQAPRYYMTATILAMMWSSLVLSQISNRVLSFCLVTFFIAWNGYAFHAHYIEPFEKNGGVDGEFTLGRFKDSNRDFRPFQKAYRWAQDQGCGHTLRWVEDDRFLRPVEFLQITTPPSSKPCPWHRNDLLFSHWPPIEKGNVKIVAQRQEWGDLTFSERIVKTLPEKTKASEVGK